MARPLVLGNGMILVGLDENGQVREFYFPYVGSENHIGRRDVHKIGVWVDNRMSWFNDEEWDIDVRYKDEMMTSDITAHNEDMRLTIKFSDVVYNEKNIFLRSMKVENHDENEREIKIFFNQQFEISQTYYADTAYYNPALHSLIHYKGRRVFLVSARDDNGSFFTEYSTGLFNIEGKEGTWRDAEDGRLSKNPIEHGEVDSTMGLVLKVKGRGERKAQYWICVGETLGEAERLQGHLLYKSEEHVIESTSNFWHAWVNNHDIDFKDLSQEAVSAFKRSLIVIRTQCDNRGGIIASGDSDQFQYGRDTYSYVWPRDGVFISLAMDKAGYSGVPERFYSFCNKVMAQGGYMLHKYQPDMSLGSSWHPWVQGEEPQLAIQEDETALLLVGLWEHYQLNKNLEFVESIYNSFIKNSAEFIKSYRDERTGLPRPSYDLWEENYAVSTFATAAVYGALVAASNFADLLGKDEERDRYARVASEIKQTIIKYLYDEDAGYFLKAVRLEAGDVIPDRVVDVSSFYGIFRFGVLPVDDGRLESAFKVTKENLSDTIPIGGVARYENDMYHAPEGGYTDVPGNPWFVTTLWLIQYKIAKARTKEDLGFINSELQWAIDHTLPSGVMSEQLDPYTGKQLSVAPLTWSHAEFVLAVMAYLDKLQEFEEGCGE
ncbi:MAG: glycoside hydrolase family 15 protein [Candidatus Paceibacterota bacterium]